MKKKVTYWRDTDSLEFEQHTVFTSMVEDSFTIGITLAAQWVNHNYLGDGILFQLFIFAFFICLIPKFQRETRIITKEEAIKLLFENEEKSKKNY